VEILRKNNRNTITEMKSILDGHSGGQMWLRDPYPYKLPELKAKATKAGKNRISRDYGISTEGGRSGRPEAMFAAPMTSVSPNYHQTPQHREHQAGQMQKLHLGMPLSGAGCQETQRRIRGRELSVPAPDLQEGERAEG
jgi:hypothetical protein